MLVQPELLTPSVTRQSPFGKRNCIYVVSESLPQEKCTKGKPSNVTVEKPRGYRRSP